MCFAGIDSLNNIYTLQRWTEVRGCLICTDQLMAAIGRSKEGRFWKWSWLNVWMLCKKAGGVGAAWMNNGKTLDVIRMLFFFPEVLLVCGYRTPRCSRASKVHLTTANTSSSQNFSLQEQLLMNQIGCKLIVICNIYFYAVFCHNPKMLVPMGPRWLFLWWYIIRMLLKQNQYCYLFWTTWLWSTRWL